MAKSKKRNEEDQVGGVVRNKKQKPKKRGC